MQVELRKVTKRFGSVLALRNVSLVVPSGQKVALVGPNGSGKSTLIRAIMGMVAVEGEVLLNGRAPFHDPLRLANQIAYVPQNPPSLSASTSELVHTVSLLRGLKESAVQVIASSLNLNLGEVWNRPVRELSGGTKEKLMVALAVAAKPSLLILDEPTASLDTASRLRFFELFEQFTVDVTVILCSHRFEEVRQLARRVVVLEAGQIAWEGEASDFLDGQALVAMGVQGVEDSQERLPTGPTASATACKDLGCEV
ncbi:MAG: ABC transporter ATP-binding protein [Acidobacteriia bacterium]|nr:ABC transporter ATP-binding protein [Terriglobia bacterium]